LIVSSIAVTVYEVSFSATTVNQDSIVCNALVNFEFSCEGVHCNVICLSLFYFLMVPRVSMIPVNISCFILLNLHFKISNK
jgi:hypothetical protein